MKRLTAITAALLLLSGCSYEKEVRNTSFIKAIGSDNEENGIKCASIALYDSEDVLCGKGKSIFTAVENAETAQEKSLFIGHTELFISGEGNFAESLELLIKNNRISPSCAFVCTDGSAKEIIADGDGAELSGLLSSSSRKGLIAKQSISGALDDMLGEDGIAAVPMVRGDGISMALIDSGSIKGVLTADEAKGLCWLREELRDIYLTVSDGTKTTDLLIKKSKPCLKAEENGEFIDITAEIRINATLSDSSADETAARKNAADTITSLCSKAIAKTVTVYRADVFGLEKCIRSSGIAKDEHWEDIIQRLRFFYSIKISE